MFHRPARIFVYKFLGLWGGQNVNSKTDELAESDKEVHQAPNLHMSLDNSQRGQYELTTKTIDSAIERSKKKVAYLLLEQGVPGLSICVSKDQKIAWRAAFGFCDVENLLPCETEAVMRIGSISKSLFVSAIVGPLMDEGNLDLNSSIHQYLSTEEFPKKKFQNKDSDITIKQLVTHTSGITHYNDTNPRDSVLQPIGSNGSKKVYQTEDQFSRRGFYQRETFRDVIEALKPFKDESLASEPGKFHYTTYGYVLLSAVMQKIHQSKEETKNEQIQDFWIKVLKRDWSMENTHLDEEEVIIKHRARYYLRTGLNGQLINAPYSDNSIKWAGGGLLSTTEDLVKFGNTLIDCYKGNKLKPLKKVTVESLWKRENSSYAMGFERLYNKDHLQKDEKLIVFHTGASLGASSVLMIYPDSEVVVAILVNLGNTNLKPLALSIADEFERSVDK